jgi:drug/metabolite transporter (DMT)-like permease
MSDTQKYTKLLSEIGLFYSAAIWGATFFIVKQVLETTNPVVLVGYRFLIAAILLGGFCLLTRRHLLNNVNHGFFAGLILWLLYISQTIGLGITTASNSGFITGLFVAFVPIFSLTLFRRTPKTMDVIASIISIFGLWLLTGSLTDFNIGDLFTLVAAATYALHILILDKYVKGGDDPFILSFQQFFLVGAMSLLIGGIFSLDFSISDVNVTGTIFFLAMLPTLSAFVIQVMAQKITTPLRVSLILALEPVFAGAFAWTLGSEPIVVHRAVGGLFIVLGMISSGISQTVREKKEVG